MSLEATFRKILKSHGFIIASEMMDLRGVSSRNLRRMIDSWKTYPKCMDIYPLQLTEKHYTDI